MRIKIVSLGVFALSIAGLAGTNAAQQMAVFRAETRLVAVYATILDSRGRYVDGLKRDQFQVLDNGVAQVGETTIHFQPLPPFLQNILQQGGIWATLKPPAPVAGNLT